MIRHDICTRHNFKLQYHIWIQQETYLQMGTNELSCFWHNPYYLKKTRSSISIFTPNFNYITARVTASVTHWLCKSILSLEISMYNPRYMTSFTFISYVCGTKRERKKQREKEKKKILANHKHKACKTYSRKGITQTALRNVCCAATTDLQCLNCVRA